MNWTTIGVERDTHAQLAELKDGDDDTFDNVLRRLIDQEVED